MGGVPGLRHGRHARLRRLRVRAVPSRQVHGDHVPEVARRAAVVRAPAAAAAAAAPAVHARPRGPTRGRALALYAMCWLYLSCLQANVRNMLESVRRTAETKERFGFR